MTVQKKFGPSRGLLARQGHAVIPHGEGLFLGDIIMPQSHKLKPGDRFGRLSVVSFSSVNKHRSRLYLCRCDCGTEKIFNRSDLHSGRSSSCGCLRIERHKAATSGEKNHFYIHGGSGTKLHRLWRGMFERCNDPKHISFKFYGGKGVTVCNEWKVFSVFRCWAQRNGYQNGLSIERIDPLGKYEPSNCEWITRAENTARCNKTRWGIAI